MRAMSTRNDDPPRASRPFDIDRDGFVLGEGAGIMVLERADHAVARGAKIYGVLAGIGMSNDAYHITAPEPDGEGSAPRDRQGAAQSADLTAADIGHVNAHATSTPVGDLAESNTILRAIGDHPVVTATKSMTGHMLGAAGAVEAIATVLAIKDGVVPGTRNLDNLDPEIKVDVATENRKVDLTAAINDSFGFGGHNVALVFTEGLRSTALATASPNPRRPRVRPRRNRTVIPSSAAPEPTPHRRGVDGAAVPAPPHPRPMPAAARCGTQAAPRAPQASTRGNPRSGWRRCWTRARIVGLHATGHLRGAGPSAAGSTAPR